MESPFLVRVAGVGHPTRNLLLLQLEARLNAKPTGATTEQIKDDESTLDLVSAIKVIAAGWEVVQKVVFSVASFLTAHPTVTEAIIDVGGQTVSIKGNMTEDEVERIAGRLTELLKVSDKAP